MGNEQKTEQLGMPFGTASHRLRKMILFRLLQRLEEDSCFRCGDKIVSIDELTVEHKVDWLHVSPELFWDLNNIAFAHTRCNTPSRYRGSKKGHRRHGLDVRTSSGKFARIV